MFPFLIRALIGLSHQEADEAVQVDAQRPNPHAKQILPGEVASLKLLSQRLPRHPEDRSGARKPRKAGQGLGSWSILGAGANDVFFHGCLSQLTKNKFDPMGEQRSVNRSSGKFSSSSGGFCLSRADSRLEGWCHGLSVHPSPIRGLQEPLAQIQEFPLQFLP